MLLMNRSNIQNYGPNYMWWHQHPPPLLRPHRDSIQVRSVRRLPERSQRRRPTWVKGGGLYITGGFAPASFCLGG